jgi:hypothetical protein
MCRNLIFLLPFLFCLGCGGSYERELHPPQLTEIRTARLLKLKSEKMLYLQNNPNLTEWAKAQIDKDEFFNPQSIEYGTKKEGPTTKKTYLIRLGEEYREFLKEQCEFYLQSHPNTPDKIEKAMRDNHLCLGMTKEQIQVMWGDPWTIDKMVDEKEEFTEWSYKIYAFGVALSDDYRLPPNVFCYFQNNILKRWHNASPFLSE